jgi:hypothetical protein
MPQRFFPQNFEYGLINDGETQLIAILVKWVLRMEKA